MAFPQLCIALPDIRMGIPNRMDGRMHLPHRASFLARLNEVFPCPTNEWSNVNRVVNVYTAVRTGIAVDAEEQRIHERIRRLQRPHGNPCGEGSQSRRVGNLAVGKLNNRASRNTLIVAEAAFFGYFQQCG